jgi:4-hydroxy-3-polyprenylbenzoate decarboxylase
MTFDTLTDYLTALEDGRELVRIPVEVDLRSELAEIVDRVTRQPDGGPAVLFERPAGRAVPVVANLFGSERRMCRVLGIAALDDAGRRMASLVQPELPQGWMEVLRLVPQFAQLVRLPPRSVKAGLCQQVVKLGGDVNLADLPVPQRHGEIAPVMTLGQVYTRDPETGLRHAALTPLAVRGRTQLAVHWTAHDVGFQHFAAWRAKRQQMPLAVAFGGDPLLALAAACPLPANTDPLLLAGFLRDRAVDVVKCRSLELEVPASAEIVLEGLIDTTLPPERSGPIALASGFYSPPEDVPVAQVTALTHRSNPVFPVLVPAAPAGEQMWINRAIERLFLPLVRLAVPEVVDLQLPAAGAGRNLAFVSIRKQYAGQARKVMHALWGLGWLMTAKLLIIVDAHVNVHAAEEVWFEVGANTHPGRDAVFAEGPAHMDDHAAPVRGMGHKLGLDATRKFPEEGHPRPWPDRLGTTDDIARLVTRRWGEYGFAAATDNG